MPLFGEKQDPTADDQGARAKLEWAESLLPADLAAELMSVAFRRSGDRDIRQMIDRLLSPKFNELQSRRGVKRAVGSTKELERTVPIRTRRNTVALTSSTGASASRITTTSNTFHPMRKSAVQRSSYYGHMNAIGGHPRGVIASSGGLSPSQIAVSRPCIVTLPCP